LEWQARKEEVSRIIEENFDQEILRVLLGAKYEYMSKMRMLTRAPNNLAASVSSVRDKARMGRRTIPECRVKTYMHQ
jgi:hypothetical protein